MRLLADRVQLGSGAATLLDAPSGLAEKMRALNRHDAPSHLRREIVTRFEAPQQRRPRAAGIFAGYSPQEDRPLAAYAVLIGLFNAGFAGAVVAARASGRKLPERIGVADLLLLGTATQKLSRLLAKDIVTSVLRAPFTEFGDYSGQGEVDESARGHGMQKASASSSPARSASANGSPPGSCRASSPRRG